MTALRPAPHGPRTHRAAQSKAFDFELPFLDTTINTTSTTNATNNPTTNTANTTNTTGVTNANSTMISSNTTYITPTTPIRKSSLGCIDESRCVFYSVFFCIILRCILTLRRMYRCICITLRRM